MSATPQQLACLRIGWLTACQRKNPANTRICPVCGIGFVRRGKRKDGGKLPSCCSMKCARAVQRKSGLSGKPPLLGEMIGCKVCGSQVYRHRSDPKRTYCSRACRDSDPNFHEAIRGAKHYNWKGGVSPINQLARNSPAARGWRSAVFRRDKFTCQDCSQLGGRLHAHHLLPWAANPAVRFDVSNGKTLCVTCHGLTHNKKFK